MLADARVAVGGPTGSAYDKRRHDVDHEPVAYHGNSMQFFDELINSFCACGVTDLTVLDESVAFACVSNRVPYIGLCHSELHVEKLFQRICDVVHNALTDPEMEMLYEPMAVAELAGVTHIDDGAGGNEAGGKGAGGKGAKPKPKAKAKSKPKGGGEGTGGSSGSDRLEEIMNALDGNAGAGGQDNADGGLEDSA